MFELETPQDMREVGKLVAEKYLVAKSGGIAFSEFLRMRDWIIPEAGEIIRENTDPKMARESVRLLGEMRSRAAMPFLEEAYYKSISGTYGAPSGDFLLDMSAAMFRTESFAGHKLLRKHYSSGHMFFRRTPNVWMFLADMNNISWLVWNYMHRNQDAAKYHSVKAASFIENGMYADAVSELVEAAGRFPYDGALWYKLGEVEAKIGHERFSESRIALEHDRRFAEFGVSLDNVFRQARKDLDVAMYLSPFSPEMLLDIGYGFFNAIGTHTAISCYDRAFLLKPALWVEAGLYYRRALARECVADRLAAYNDFVSASKIYTENPGIPSVVDPRVSTIEEGINRTKPYSDNK